MKLCLKCSDGLIQKDFYFRAYICNKCYTRFSIGEIEYEKVINFLKQNSVKPRELKSVIDVAQKCDVTPEELFDLLVVIKDLSRL